MLNLLAEDPVLIPRAGTFQVSLLFAYENEVPRELIVSSWLPPEDWEECKNSSIDSQWDFIFRCLLTFKNKVCWVWDNLYKLL